MSVIASAYTAIPRTSIQGAGQAAALRIRLTDYIEANLGDPELIPPRSHRWAIFHSAICTCSFVSGERAYGIMSNVAEWRSAHACCAIVGEL